MEPSSITVEMADYRAASFSDFKHLKALFRFADFGIEARIARTRLINYNVFAGALYGIVPILRMSTAYASGTGVCLSQVLSNDEPAPIMGKTAMVSPINATLLDTEKQIAASAFRMARVKLKK